MYRLPDTLCFMGLLNKGVLCLATLLLNCLIAHATSVRDSSLRSMEYPDTLVCPSCKISETNSLDITKSDITNLEYLNEYKDFKMIGKTKDRRVLLLSGIPILRLLN